MVELREDLVKRPGVGVFIDLRLPAVGYLRGNAGAVYHRQPPVKSAGELLGGIAFYRRLLVKAGRQVFQQLHRLGDIPGLIAYKAELLHEAQGG